jgi:hypothetical protein
LPLHSFTGYHEMIVQWFTLAGHGSGCM